MNICPVCGNEEIAGALFCSECGERLKSKGKIAVRDWKEFLGAEIGQDNSTSHVSEDLKQKPSPGLICIKLIESSKIIPLKFEIPIILGRLVEDQPLLPDIDLTGLSAYTNGVSRLHAEFCWTEEGVFVSDLGSVNGTFISGVKVEPNTWIRARIGDIVELGKVEVEIMQC